MVPPVNLSLQDDESGKRVVLSFAFYSGFGASLIYTDSSYTIEQW